MPLLLRVWSQAGMVAGPVLLCFVVLPISDWTVNGRRMSYADFWASGAGASAALFVGLLTVGPWGMAARRPGSRWLLVFAPLAPVVLVPSSPLLADTPYWTIVLSQVVTSMIIFWCLFYLQPVKRYLESDERA